MDNVWQLFLAILFIEIFLGLVYFFSRGLAKELQKNGLSVYGNSSIYHRGIFAAYCTLIGIFQWLFWQHVVVRSKIDISPATTAIALACISGALIGWIPSKHKLLWPLHWFVSVNTFVFTYIGFLLASYYLTTIQAPYSASLLLTAFTLATINVLVVGKYHFSAVFEIFYLCSLVGWDLTFWIFSRSWS